jgi:hypothetical protein
VDNIKKDLGEIVWSGMYWVSLAQDREKLSVLVKAAIHFRVPYNAGKWLHN